MVYFSSMDASTENRGGVGAEPGADSEKPHLLVVDDSRVIRKAVAKILGEDFVLLEAEDGEAAWERLTTDERIAVMVTDIDMPRLDGYGLLCRLRAAEAPRLRELPVIVITGAEDETTRSRAYACGATDFITKPLDHVQLLARARAHARLDQTTRLLSEAEQALEAQSTNDALTGLASRRYLLARGAEALASARRRGEELSLLRIDIDNFRMLYDTHGHEPCQRLLAWLAKRLAANCRAEDTLARLRGAQFAVLAPATGRMDAAILAERLRQVVAEEPFTDGSTRIPVTISLGLATFGREPGENIEALIAVAEHNLTLAKAEGGNRLSYGYAEEILPPEEAVIAEPDLETALALVANGETGKLLPYLPNLVARVLPLLELGNQHLDLGLDLALAALKERLAELK